MHDIFLSFRGLRSFFLIFALLLFSKLFVCQRVHFNFIYDYNIARYLQGGYDDFVLEEGDYEVFIYEPEDYDDLIFDIPQYDDIALYAVDFDDWMYDFPEYEQDYFEFAEIDYQNLEYGNFEYDNYEYDDYEYDDYEYEDYEFNTTYAVNYSNTNALNYSYYFNYSEGQDPVALNATSYLDSTLDNATDDLIASNFDGYNDTDDRSNFTAYNETDYSYTDDDVSPYTNWTINSRYNVSYNMTDYLYSDDDANPYSNWSKYSRYNVSSYWKDEQFAVRHPIVYEILEVPVFELVPDFPILIDDEDLEPDEIEVY